MIPSVDAHVPWPQEQIWKNFQNSKQTPINQHIHGLQNAQWSFEGRLFTEVMTFNLQHLANFPKDPSIARRQHRAAWSGTRTWGIWMRWNGEHQTLAEEIKSGPLFWFATSRKTFYVLKPDLRNLWSLKYIVGQRQPSLSTSSICPQCRMSVTEN